MDVKRVYNFLLKRATDYGTYYQNGRLQDNQDDFGDALPGTYGNPLAGSYGAALDKRVTPAVSSNNGTFLSGSMSMPSGFTGRDVNITQQALDANRPKVAAINAEALKANPKQTAWATEKLIQGGANNAASWKASGKLAPKRSVKDFKNDVEFNTMTPVQQRKFIDVYNSTASTNPHNRFNNYI